ncbi:MAG TPA: 2-oxoglutarate ferredoxin oxidoreductase subunit alpha, partial [Acidimicrobiia bacterium]|nr:2-oxoglutarate ferredoxin oxidoreductase subunit alpha [Acidimicrobiia bacterium]
SAAGVAIGAAFAGNLAITGTSGPGVDLKSESIGLAVSLELPMIIVDVQRGGPSTGLPTKTEQADLMLAMYGRHGEAPLPIIAACSPSDCFDTAFEAARIALKFRTPVILLTDGYLANGAEPWALPDVDALPDISVPFATELNHGDEFWPYLRDPETLARPWAIPGTPGLMHRVGGIEKEDGTGNISYDPENHDRMTRVRAAKIAGIARDIPLTPVDDPDGADICVLSWGGTWGAATAAVRRVRTRDKKIAHVHLRHLNPFPRDLGEVLARYRTVFVPELNLGHLAKLVRAEFLIDARSYSRVAGVPFRAAELEQQILEMMNP